MQFQHEYIRDRAYFVAGRPAKFRDGRNPKIESAIRDVEHYLEVLPDDLAKPIVSGATSVSKDNFLVLTWLVLDHDHIKEITAEFFGRGMCAVSWPDQPKDQVFENISISRLEALRLPDVISRFRPAHRQSAT